MPYTDFYLFEDPAEPQLKIWRYMDFEKFISLLERKEVFFCRADRFSDPYEGSYPRKEIEARASNYKRERGFFGQTPSVEETTKHLKDREAFNEQFRSLNVINCWHYNRTESDAMWQLYLKSSDGVAVQSTFTKLKNSFSGYDKPVYAGKVRYLNYDTDIFYSKKDFPHYQTNTFIPLIHKRNAFIHEQEYRVMTEVDQKGWKHDWDNSESKNGKFIPADLDTLIEKIILSPNCSPQFQDQVNALVKKHGHAFVVEKSKLNEPPQF